MQSQLQISESVVFRGQTSNLLLITQDVNPTKVIQIQLSQEKMRNDKIDLDMQCVLLNELGQMEDAVSKNQRQLKNKAIILSKDMGTGSYSSETLSIILQDLPFEIKYLAVLDCSFKGQPFKFIETNKILVTQQSKLLQSQQFSGNTVGKSRSSMPCLFQRQFDGKWTFTIIEETGEGQNFKECEDLIKKGLIKGGFDEVLFLNCKKWEGNKQFALSKSQALPIPDALQIVSVGLGWKTLCDVDCSVLLFDDTQKFIENVFFGNLTNSNGSVVHHGDSITGKGEGDVEIITINLQKLPNNVKTIWAVITIELGLSFKDVSGAFCRLFSQESKKQFCIFNLSEQRPDKKCNGNIMCCITRCKDSQWTVSPKGYFTTNTTMAKDLIPIIQEIQQNKFTNVIIVKQSSPDVLINTQNEDSCCLANNTPRELEYQNEFQIEIQSAIDLDTEGSNQIFTPYVSCKLNQRKIQKTKSIQNTQNPNWNFKFFEKLTLGDIIQFKIKSQRLLGGNKYLGTCFYEVNQELFEGGSLKVSLQAMNKEKQVTDYLSGVLFVKFMKATRR